MVLDATLAGQAAGGDSKGQYGMSAAAQQQNDGFCSSLTGPAVALCSAHDADASDRHAVPCFDAVSAAAWAVIMDCCSQQHDAAQIASAYCCKEHVVCAWVAHQLLAEGLPPQGYLRGAPRASSFGVTGAGVPCSRCLLAAPVAPASPRERSAQKPPDLAHLYTDAIDLRRWDIMCMLACLPRPGVADWQRSTSDSASASAMCRIVIILLVFRKRALG